MKYVLRKTGQQTAEAEPGFFERFGENKFGNSLRESIGLFGWFISATLPINRTLSNIAT
jgi:hypothetical protein